MDFTEKGTNRTLFYVAATGRAEVSLRVNGSVIYKDNLLHLFIIAR
jgi:hypothetical protein